MWFSSIFFYIILFHFHDLDHEFYDLNRFGSLILPKLDFYHATSDLLEPNCFVSFFLSDFVFPKVFFKLS
jgi:hypothetical protein